MGNLTFEDLLKAGVHFGHLRRKWNPKMAPYIFMERNGIHIIDLNKTLVKLDEAKKALKQIAKSGRKILFVATKKQAKEIVAEAANSVNMPYVTERWPGGMLTNFPTIRKAIKKMNQIDKLMESPAFSNLSKRERLQIQRQRAKLEKNLGSIADLSRLPSALFIIDINKEHIALKEAIRLNIPVFAIVDTNTDPTKVDFPIPGNDDASESIAILVNDAVEAIKEGLEERRLEKEKNKKDKPIKDKKIEKVVGKKSQVKKKRKPTAKKTEEKAVEKEEVKAEVVKEEVEEETTVENQENKIKS